MAAYVAVADGLSFGACRRLDRRRRRGRSSTGCTADRSVRVAAARCAAVVVRRGSPSRSSSGRVASERGAAAADSPPGFLRADGNVIADGDGNQVLLRGVNVNQLVDFYRPRPEVDDTVR